MCGDPAASKGLATQGTSKWNHGGNKSQVILSASKWNRRSNKGLATQGMSKLNHGGNKGQVTPGVKVEPHR